MLEKQTEFLVSHIESLHDSNINLGSKYMISLEENQKKRELIFKLKN